MTDKVVCDVAIIGGGVIGLSCARELMAAGIGRVVVLEKEGAVGTASSSRANGGVRAQFTTAVNIDFSLYSIGEFERMREESAGLLSFHQTGYLLMAGTEEGERGLQTAFELQRERGVDTRWLSAEDVASHTPFIRTEGLRAGTFHGRDGFLDPHTVVQVMRQSALSRGAQVLTNSGVKGIDDFGDRFLLSTYRVEVEAGWVVDAAGAHASEIAGLAGIDVPVEPVRRNLAYIHDGGPRELIPMCVDLDTGVLVRREVAGGYVVAYSDPEDEPGWDVSVDPKFFEDLADRIGNRFPFLEEAPVDPARSWAGLYPETVDHHAIVGASAENERFVICAGFGGHGIMHSPAAGRAVAELIADGHCSTFDLRQLRPTRFAENDLVIETAVL